MPNALAALLLHIRDLTHRRPHVYFEWTEGNPAGNFLRYPIFGQGEIASVTREILRRQEPDPTRRPRAHRLTRRGRVRRTGPEDPAPGPPPGASIKGVRGPRGSSWLTATPVPPDGTGTPTGRRRWSTG
ncbi:hypothetical protein O7607_22805 [Micromonospora sp. WMMA1949]|uniref:hypothetical protein n=1 Tax=unclassified Micromonospora TaxID=2617518 RepID=UPI0022B6F674|nr:hypothetical protein [Micromonospora sp. WMMA1949]MCZ7428576.1 hypothetical protein [Micromonospora sp. WMMA1949]